MNAMSQSKMGNNSLYSSHSMIKRSISEIMCLSNLILHYLYKSLDTNYDYCFEQ